MLLLTCSRSVPRANQVADLIGCDEPLYWPVDDKLRVQIEGVLKTKKRKIVEAADWPDRQR